MDEPVEPPFTEHAQAQAPAQPPGDREKLVIEMPFNNDITFPIPLLEGETVGELRRRIGAIIGVEQSRVLISKRSPALNSDIPVEAAAEENRLQLVVRSSFDFERLRQLVEADRYLPVIPPPEVDSAAPSPVNSPEMQNGSGFPWRNNVMSPRRQPTRPVLKIKLENGLTVEIEDSLAFKVEGEHVCVSPALDERLRSLTGQQAPPPPLAAREILAAAAAQVMDYYHVLHARGLPQFIGILTFVYLTSRVADIPRKYTLIVNGVLFAVGMLHLANIFRGNPINWLELIRMPDIYDSSQDIRALASQIPAEFRDNTDLDTAVQRRILNAMRQRLSVFDLFKVLVVSLLPTLYDDWVRRVEQRKEAHVIAIKMVTERNIEVAARKALEDMAPALGPAPPPRGLAPPTNPLAEN